MKLTLTRSPSKGTATIGKLTADGVFIAFTLEDVTRDTKIFGRTAIPAGTYQVVITYSPHFQRDLPLLVNVPDYQGVRIHPGNTAADTEGCILPGNTVAGDEQSIGQSKVAFDKVYNLIQGALDQGEQVTINIING